MVFNPKLIAESLIGVVNRVVNVIATRSKSTGQYKSNKGKEMILKFQSFHNVLYYNGW